MMAGLLQKEDFDELLKWIGGRRKFRLLYKITRDGCSAPTFHSKCDGKGMTVTVLSNPSDTVYGGFTSQSWTSAGAYVPDLKAFLFQLKFNGKSSYNQFPIKTEQIANAVYCHPGCGPTFGGGHDLCTFGNGNLTASNGVFTFNGGCTLNNTYNMKGTDYNAFANGNLQVKEMEVYQVDGELSQYELLYFSDFFYPVYSF